MIWIVQYLCPSRHCIMGAAYDDGEDTFEGIKDKITTAMKDLGVNFKCELCGSTELHFENAPTRFRTLEEAEPLLRIEEAKQMIIRAAILQHRRMTRN